MSPADKDPFGDHLNVVLNERDAARVYPSAETTPTTLRDREPGTEAGKALTRLGQAHVIAFATAARITTDTANRIVRAIEEQAATEARRELLAKVRSVYVNAKADESFGHGWDSALDAVLRLIEPKP